MIDLNKFRCRVYDLLVEVRPMVCVADINESQKHNVVGRLDEILEAFENE